MGCVQSQEDLERHKRRRQSPRQQQQFRQQPLRHESKSHQVNGRQRRMSSEHVYENVSSNHRKNEDVEFRRQHFDRNSCLRHSKKRKKSSASLNASTTVTSESAKNNNTNGKPKIFSYENESATTISPVEQIKKSEPQMRLKPEVRRHEVPKPEVQASSKEEPKTASSIVAAILAQETTKANPIESRKVRTESRPKQSPSHSHGRDRSGCGETSSRLLRTRRQLEGEQTPPEHNVATSEPKEDCGRLI